MMAELLAQQTLADVPKQTVGAHHVVVSHRERIGAGQRLSIWVADINIQRDRGPFRECFTTDTDFRIVSGENLLWQPMSSYALSSRYRQRLVTEMFCTKVSHPLGICYQRVDATRYVFGQHQGIGKHAILVAAYHQPLHQRVGLLVVQLHIDEA